MAEMITFEEFQKRVRYLAKHPAIKEWPRLAFYLDWDTIWAQHGELLCWDEAISAVMSEPAALQDAAKNPEESPYVKDWLTSRKPAWFRPLEESKGRRERRRKEGLS